MRRAQGTSHGHVHIRPDDRSGTQRDYRRALLNVCFVLCVINVVYFPVAYFSHWWIYDPNGLGIPTDFVNVWAAGRLVLDGHPGAGL